MVNYSIEIEGFVLAGSFKKPDSVEAVELGGIGNNNEGSSQKIKRTIMKIETLIIDDHQLFNDGLSMILNDSTDFEVIGQVYDSRQAIYEIKKLNPKLILVDYNMPFMNGLELVKKIKQIEANFKIVTISMYADKHEIKLFKEAGVDGYIPKTTQSLVLLECLIKVMNGQSVFLKLHQGEALPVVDPFSLKLQLTKREIEILSVLKKGLTTEQAANHLNLSYHTITTHRKNINQKLKIKSSKDFYKFLEEFSID